MSRTAAGRRTMAVTRRLPRIARDGVNRLIVSAQLSSSTRRADPILVYSMPKVGTTSLAKTISRVSGQPVIHCHYLHPTQTRLSLRAAFSFGSQAPLTAWRGRFVERMIRRRTPSRPWHIVCGVRDPIARAVSDEFYHHFIGDHHIEVDAPALVGELTGRIEQRFADGQDESSTWLIDELRRTTGIDVYATAFDRDRGFEIFEHGNFKVLLVRFEDLNRVGGTAVAEFLGLDEIGDMEHHNSASDRAYREVYRMALRGARFSDRCVDRAYSGRLAQHFYSAAERETFEERWRVDMKPPARPAGG